MKRQGGRAFVTRKKILIVDDDPDFAEGMAQLCQEFGLAATTAGTADRALQKLESQIFDFALIDNVMPGKNGMELVSSMRQKHINLPVVICTGYETNEIREKMSALRIRSVLNKPVDRGMLEQLLVDTRTVPAQSPAAKD